MTYHLQLSAPNTDPILENGETPDPLTFMKQRLARFLLEHPGLQLPGSVLTVQFEQPAE
jgi:hypothetical protein